MWPILFLVALVAAIPTAGVSLLWFFGAYLAFKAIAWLCMMLYIGHTANQERREEAARKKEEANLKTLTDLGRRDP